MNRHSQIYSLFSFSSILYLSHYVSRNVLRAVSDGCVAGMGSVVVPGPGGRHRGVSHRLVRTQGISLIKYS